MDIIEMRQNYSNHITEMENFLNTSGGDHGILTAENKAKYEEMETTAVALQEAITRKEKLENTQKSLELPSNTPLKTTLETPTNTSFKDVIASDEYKACYSQALRTKFTNVDNALRVGMDTEGGYLVPEEYDHRLIQARESHNFMRSVGTVIQTGGTHRIPIVTGKPIAYWADESSPAQFTSTEFDQIVLEAYKMRSSVKVTDELLADENYNLESYIFTALGRSLGELEEHDFLFGADPTRQPTGLFHPDKGGTWVNGTTNPLNFDTLIDLIYSLKSPYRANASFILSDTVIPQLRKMKDANGQYIWQPSAVAGEPDRILGYRVHTTHQFANDFNAVAFGDYSYYNIGDRGSRTVRTLNELYAATGHVAYMATQRVDGMLTLPESVQLMKLDPVATLSTEAKAKAK